MESYTPEQIRLANIARKALRNKGEKRVRLIRDERQVAVPRNPYMFYYLDRQRSGDFKGIGIGDSGRLAGSEWKTLTALEKKVCHLLLRDGRIESLTFCYRNILISQRWTIKDTSRKAKPCLIGTFPSNALRPRQRLQQLKDILDSFIVTFSSGEVLSEGASRWWGAVIVSKIKVIHNPISCFVDYLARVTCTYAPM